MLQVPCCQMSHRRVAIALGVGARAACCIAFGIAALRNPKRVGGSCGLGVDATRVMGVRDLVVGTLLAVRPSAGLLAARAAIDAGDTILLARRTPTVAAIAAAFGLANAALARTVARSR